MCGKVFKGLADIGMKKSVEALFSQLINGQGRCSMPSKPGHRWSA
jgi:hypothetical protein